MGEMLFTNFSSGELSDTLFGRIDIEAYYRGTSRLKNFAVIPTGGIARRPGSKRLDALSGDCRLIPFIVSTNLAYILEFGVGYIKVWKNGEKVLSGGVQLGFTTESLGFPLYGSLEYIREIQYAQHYDTMIFVHRNYPPLELRWIGGDGFSLGKTQFDFTIGFEINDPDDQYTPPPGETTGPPLFDGPGKYPGCAAFFLGRLWFASSINEPQKVWASDAPDRDGNHYNRFSPYKKYVTVSKILKEADLHIFTGNITSGSTVITGVSQDLTAALSNPAAEYYLSGDFFPVGTRVVSIFAASITVDKTPTETKESQVMTIQLWKTSAAASGGDYRYVTETNEITVDSNSFSFEIASDQNDAIRWMAQNNYLVLGTEVSEWVVPNTVTANRIQAALNSRHGSDRLQGTCIGNAIVFFSTGRKSIKEYYFQSQEETFLANDIAMLAPQMLREAAAIDFDFVSNPYTRILVTRNDGAMAVLLYEKSSAVMGWYRYELASGAVLSCATVPGNNGYDDVYVAVKKGSVVTLERLEEEGAVYLDRYAAYTGSTAGYDAPAVIYDKTANRTYPLAAPPSAGAITGHEVYIGYPYESRMRSMPVLADSPNEQKRISAVLFRFKESFLPLVAAYPATSVEHITGHEEPFSGVIRVPFPGGQARDVMFIISTDKPAPCTVLAVNAETA
jgi:hypothetical protein